MTTIEKLQTKLAMLTLDPRDFPGTWTQRQREAHETGRRVLEACIRAAHNATAVLSEWKSKLAADISYRDALNAVRAALCTELLELPQRPRTGLELGQRMNLTLSIRVADRGLDCADGSGWDYSTLTLGHLMREAGLEWRGPLHAVEARIRDAQRRVDDAQQQLDNALRVEVEVVVEPAPVASETV
jgi:hypothetical protein